MTHADPRFPDPPHRLDARARTEFESGHARGAVHLPPETWDERAAELPPRDAECVVIAASPGEAEVLAARLRARGFARARAAEPSLLAAREETGSARAVLWRPSPWLVAAAPHLPRAGVALDVATGSGRHAAWLACRGLATWGVDLLPDALARARGLAGRAPLAAPLGFALADATRALPFRGSAFDVVCGFRYLDRALFARLAFHLRPGGVLVWETFVRGTAPLARPRRPEHVLEPGELPRLCRAAGLVPVAWRETDSPDGPAFAAIAARREPAARPAARPREPA